MTDEIDENEAQLLEAISAQEPTPEYKALSGAPLPAGTERADMQTIIDAIRQVYDPEIPINVYDMGLIYHIDIQENGDIFIDMSLTAPGCPVAGVLPAQVAQAVADVEGAGVTTVKVVWEPQWTIERMTEEGRAMIDLF